jgi:antitoxin component YwqK of YwqJK toxin-antitoxin module
MNQQDFENAFILLLSGAAEISERGIKWQDEFGIECFIKFVDLNPNKAIVTWWYKNGQKRCEEEYQNGHRHGKYSGWYENGQKHWEGEWQNGQLHGKRSWWYENGQKRWEEEYLNGQLHGKSFWWWENGKKSGEEEWQNGIRIK